MVVMVEVESAQAESTGPRFLTIHFILDDVRRVSAVACEPLGSTLVGEIHLLIGCSLTLC